MSTKEPTTSGEQEGEPSSAPGDDPQGGASSWYEVLDLSPTATASEIEKGYQHALDLIEGRTIGGYFLLDPVAVDSARADIEAAFFVLGDAGRRAAYDARRSLAAPASATAESAPSASAPPAVTADAPDEVTASDARRLLGLPSGEAGGPSGEGVFAPLSPAAAAALAEKDAAKDAAQEAAPTPTTTAPPRRAALKFLSPVVEPAPTPPPPREETSSPGRSVGGIFFAPPLTDGRIVLPTTEPTPTPPAPRPTPPPPTTAPDLTPTMTVLPTATMPAPDPTAATTTTTTTTEPPTNLPVAVTPQPQPGLFSLEGTEVNGQLLKRLREARGLTLEAMVEATKIRKPYLRAIEEQDLENLPARVYLRGFLTQIARVLRVDKVKLAEGYLAFVARYGK